MLSEGTIVDDTYQILQEIGRGGAGVVYLAYHLRLEKYVVLKGLYLPEANMELLRNEVDTLKELHHPALPQVYDFLQYQGELYTVIEYIDGADFERLVAEGVRFDEAQLAAYLLDVAEVLAYLHRHDPPVLHSDIKPGNLMRRIDGTICLIDFNVSVYQNGAAGIYGFTRHYSSPEQCRLGQALAMGFPSDIILDGRSDIYALGATFYYIMTGVCPGDDYIYPIRTVTSAYSDDFVRIVERAMACEPGDRFQTAEEMVQQLKRYMRRGIDFRRKCVTQAVLLCVCGLLLCCGIWSITYGLREKRHEGFMDQYGQIQLEAQNGEYDQVVTDGVRLLNAYEDQRDRNPANWFYLLRAVADGYAACGQDAGAEAGAQELLRQAALFYFDAAELAVEEQMEEREDCVNACAELLTRLGDGETLIRLSQLAAQYDPQSGEIISIRAAAVFGDTEGARARLKELAGTCGDAGIRYEAYLGLASLEDTDFTARIQYLEAALSEKQTEDAARQLARVYMQFAEQAPSPEEYYGHAAELYAALCGENALFSDRMGYVSACRASGQLQEAEQMLGQLLREYPERFDVAAQAALLHRQLGQVETAKQYASLAQQLATDSEKEENETLLRSLEHILQEP